VVLRPPREKLAVLKPFENIIMLETMHFADELREASEVDAPTAQVGQKELDMAVSLVETMADKWEPKKYHDEYRDALTDLIEKKIKGGGKAVMGAKTKGVSATRIVDLVLSVLEKSLKEAQGKPRKKPAHPSVSKGKRRKWPSASNGASIGVEGLFSAVLSQVPRYDFGGCAAVFGRDGWSRGNSCCGRFQVSSLAFSPRMGRLPHAPLRANENNMPTQKIAPGV
jgi:hypothetical protein